MGAAATVSKEEDDVSLNRKVSPSLKPHSSSVIVCSGCKTPLGIFKRKVSFSYVREVDWHMCFSRVLVMW